MLAARGRPGDETLDARTRNLAEGAPLDEEKAQKRCS